MRLSPIAFASLLLLASCSAPEPTVTIRGTVAAADGSALDDTWITVCDQTTVSWRRPCFEPMLQAQLADGSFEVNVPARPILQVVAVAPGVEAESVRLITEEPETTHEVAFELGRPNYHPAPEQMVLHFLRDGVVERRLMTQEDSGIWTAVLGPYEAETLYRFIGATLGTRSISAGTLIDSERPNTVMPSGALWSVAPGSEDSIRFTYAHGFMEKIDGRVSFGAESRNSKIWRHAEQRFQAYVDAFYEGWPPGEEDPSEYVSRYDWSGAETLRDSLLHATQDLTREAVALSYLTIIRDVRSDNPSEDTRMIMDTVSPSSPAWDWTLRWAPSLLISGAEDPLAVGNYLRQVFVNMSNDSLAASMMASTALTFGDPEGEQSPVADSLAMAMYLDLVQAYPNAWATKQAAKSLAPDRAIQIGQPVPAFKLTSLDESDRVISRESLLGTTYLVDFWGSWCAPCIREMPFMHAAYEKYKDRRFTILSFAWDRRESVDTFRETWPMPWEHILLEGYPLRESNTLLEAFHVGGFPDVLLVGADGVIIEVDDDHLRETALDSTLAVHLGPVDS